MQGLGDDTKLNLLRMVVKRELTLNELRDKARRIKKKQLVVNAFLKHTGEVSFQDLKTRFPLHSTEEKLAQFANSNVTRKSIPQVGFNEFQINFKE